MKGRIFVTGADGFIGSHLCEALVEAGYPVRALCQYNSFDDRGWLDDLEPAVLESVEVVAGDVRDPGRMLELTRDCDAVLHLAALIAIPYSYHAPRSYLDTNVLGTLNVLEAVRAHDVSRLVQISTSEVYGSAQRVPIDEDHPLVGQSPYAASKIAADQLALSFYRSFGTPVAVARPFNTYGPRQSSRAVIPTVIAQIASGRETVELGALSPTRDFNFVKDTVSGMIATLESDASVGEVINIGSGFEISVGDTAQLIAEVMNADVEIVSTEERRRPEASEVSRLFACNRKAGELLGWRPRYGRGDGFREGLAATAAWFCDPRNLARYRVDGYVI